MFCLRKGYLIKQFSIYVHAYHLRIPVHHPYMELRCPHRVFSQEMREGYADTVPGVSVVVAKPARIGKYYRLSLFCAIKLHQVEFSVCRPAEFVAECPYCRPCTPCDRNPCSYLKSAIAIIEAGRCVFYPLALSAPVAATGFVHRIGTIFETCSYYKTAVFYFRVFRLIPLVFMVADKSVFIVPVGGGGAVNIKFITPDESVIMVISRCGENYTTCHYRCHKFLHTVYIVRLM